MASLQNQTSINSNRFFFATTEAGEQVLNTSTQASGNFTDFFVGISGPQGNSVQINQMPDIIGTVTTGGEEMLYAGTASTYKTLSSLSVTAVGTSISVDRIPGSGLTTIESYAANGPYKGFEFLARGVNSALQSTPMDSYLSTIGAPGACAKLGGNGQFVAGQGVVAPVAVSLSPPDVAGGIGCFSIDDLSGGNPYGRWSFFKFNPTSGSNAGSDLALGAYNDNGNFLGTALTASRAKAQIATINGYAYPQPLLSTICTGSQTITMTSNTPTILFSTTSASTSNLVPGQNYLIDLPAGVTVSNPGATGAFLELGARIGGSGAGFNYLQTMFVPPGGLPAQGVSAGIVQICDMGSTNFNLELIGYLQGATGLTVTTSQPGGGAVAYMKQIT